MKKSFLLFIFLINCFYFYSQETEITDLTSDNKLYGTSFFPVFVGEKWNYEIRSKGVTSNLQWTIVSMHKINDPANNLKDVTGFKTLIRFKANGKDLPDLNSEFFLIVNDDYISNYNKTDKSYILEKILPVNPKAGDSWTSEGTNYKVTEISENSVKVESSDVADGKTGYQLFVKDTGPFEIYENNSKTNEETYLTLLDSTSFQQQNKPAFAENMTDTPPKQPEANGNKPSENPAVQTSINEKMFTDYITVLSNDKKYVQAGAFNVRYYAEDLASKIKAAGFNSKIFQDKDGFYKVLVETNDPAATIKNVTEKMNIKCFQKKK